MIKKHFDLVENNRGKWNLATVLLTVILYAPALTAVAAPSSDNEVRFEQSRIIHERQTKELEKPYIGIDTDIYSDKQTETDTAEVAGPAFQIKRIELEGTDRTFCGLDKIIKAQEGKRMTLKDIRNLAEQLTRQVKQHGFITSRIVVPKQNIKAGIVRLTFIPGLIRAFLYAEGSEKAYYKNAFSTGPGEILNIRDLEQGLEQIRRVQNQDVKIKIVPRDEGRSSDIMMSFSQGQAWSIVIMADNTGDKASGKMHERMNLGWDNLLGINDTAAFGIVRNLWHEEQYKKYRQKYFSYSVPYQKYLFSYRYSDSTTSQPMDFLWTKYPYTSHTQSRELRVEKLIKRTGDSKLRAQAAVTTYRRRNLIADSELNVQRLDKTNLSYGLLYDRYYAKGQLNGAIYLSKGIPWFGAQKENSLAEAPKTRSYILSSDIAFSNWQKLRERPLQYRMLLHAQQSAHELYSVDEISIGGLYTVRGFTGEHSIAGKSGWYMQNEWRLYGGKIQPFAGVDIGAVYGSNDTASKHMLSGAVIGIRGGSKYFYSFSAATPLIRPAEWQKDHIVIYGEAGFNF